MAESAETEGCGAPSLLQLQQKQEKKLTVNSALTGASVADLEEVTDTADATSVEMSRSVQGKKKGGKKKKKKGKKGKKGKNGKKGKKGKKVAEKVAEKVEEKVEAAGASVTPAPTSVQDLLDGKMTINGFKKFGDGGCTGEDGEDLLCYLRVASLVSPSAIDEQCAIYCYEQEWCQGFTTDETEKTGNQRGTCCMFPYPDTFVISDPGWPSGHKYYSKSGGNSDVQRFPEDSSEAGVITTTKVPPGKDGLMECYLSQNAFTAQAPPTPPPTVSPTGTCKSFCKTNVNPWTSKCGWNDCEGCKQCNGVTIIMARGKR